MNQNRSFFTIFAVIVGALFVLSLGVQALSTQVTDHQYRSAIKAGTDKPRDVLERIKPIGSVGTAASADAASAAQTKAGREETGARPEPVDQALTGPQVYNNACLACQGAGIAGAPVLGNRQAWAPRIDKGRDVLYDHSLNGFQGNAGYMPPKGGRTDLSDDEVKRAVDYMIAEARQETEG